MLRFQWVVSTSAFLLLLHLVLCAARERFSMLPNQDIPCQITSPWLFQATAQTMLLVMQNSKL